MELREQRGTGNGVHQMIGRLQAADEVAGRHEEEPKEEN